MTTEQYVADLRQAVRSLPPDEAVQAVAYYDEYLHDAADPAAAMAGLGTPKEVAAKILADYVGKSTTRPGIGVLWAVILGILAAPVAAPLAIAAFSIVLALVITVFALVFSLLAAAVALALGGASLVVTGFMVIGQGAVTVVWMIGGGLLCLAIGLVATFGLIALGRVVVTGLARWAASIIEHYKKGKQS